MKWIMITWFLTFPLILKRKKCFVKKRPHQGSVKSALVQDCHWASGQYVINLNSNVDRKTFSGFNWNNKTIRKSWKWHLKVCGTKLLNRLHFSPWIYSFNFLPVVIALEGWKVGRGGMDCMKIEKKKTILKIIEFLLNHKKMKFLISLGAFFNFLQSLLLVWCKIRIRLGMAWDYFWIILSLSVFVFFSTWSFYVYFCMSVQHTGRNFWYTIVNFFLLTISNHRVYF